MDVQLPYATAVQMASTAWRLRRKSQIKTKGQGVKVYLVRMDGAERLLSHMTAGSLVLRSQTITKGSTPVFVSYRIRSSIHHQKVQTVVAAWKLVKNGVPQCLLDSQALAIVQTLQDVFLPTMSTFLRQVASHRHFVDKDLSAICVRLELQYREFLICRSARHQLLVCTLDPDKTAVKSIVIRIDCTACRLICRDVSGSERTITTLDEALSCLLGRDTSRDTAQRTREKKILQRGPAEELIVGGTSQPDKSPFEIVAVLRTAMFEEDNSALAGVLVTMHLCLAQGGPSVREAWLKDGALEPTVHAFLNRSIAHAHHKELIVVLELLMGGDHNTNLDVSVMMTARIVLCRGDGEELSFVLKTFNSLLHILPFRRACARNDELLSHICKLHEKYSISTNVRLDGASSLEWQQKETHEMKDDRHADNKHDDASFRTRLSSTHCTLPSTHRTMLSEFERLSSDTYTSRTGDESWRRAESDE
jgi:hypothetical protein